MLQYTEVDLDVQGVTIHYYRTGGRKPPFILLHGATDNGLCWSPVAEYFSDRFDVIMPDAQGHGKSERFTIGSSEKTHAFQIAGLIKQLKLDKPLVMGHSMGAGITANLAADFPDLPKAILLEDPGWQLPGSISFEPENTRKDMVKDLARHASHSLAQIKEDGHRSNPKWSEAELAPWAESKTQFDQALFNYPPPNPTAYLDFVVKIDCPALLITAENGKLAPVVAMEIEKIWKSRHYFKWARVMSAGHNIRREQFMVFTAIVNSYISELP
jgi:pimeloyl-ACP methyl ester carboxylesterase